MAYYRFSRPSNPAFVPGALAAFRRCGALRLRLDCEFHLTGHHRSDIRNRGRSLPGAPSKYEVPWRTRKGRGLLATGGTRGLEFLHFMTTLILRQATHQPDISDAREFRATYRQAGRSG